MAFVEDLEPFFDPAMPGVYEAIYDGSIAVNVEFEADFYETFDVTEGYLPRIGCVEADVPGIAHGKTFTLNGATYVVRAIRGLKSGVLNLQVQLVA